MAGLPRKSVIQEIAERRAGLAERIESLRTRGYDTRRLEEAMSRDLNVAAGLIDTFERDLPQLFELKGRLDALSLADDRLRARADLLRSKLTDPIMVREVGAEVAILEGLAKTEERKREEEISRDRELAKAQSKKRNSAERQKRASSEAVRRFLSLDAEEAFDLEALNAMDFRIIAAEAASNRDLLPAIVARIDALAGRVEEEMASPSNVAKIVRRMTMEWMNRSPIDADWAARMPEVWGGVFHETHVPGGRRKAPLLKRLRRLSVELNPRWRVGIRPEARGRLGENRRQKGSRESLQRVVQAYLDDLAVTPAHQDRAGTLPALTELTHELGGSEVNRILGELFPSEGGAFLVVDPKLGSDRAQAALRPPSPRASRTESAYILLHGKELAREGGGVGPVAEGGATWDKLEACGTLSDVRSIIQGLATSGATLPKPPVPASKLRQYRNLLSLLFVSTEVRQQVTKVLRGARLREIEALAKLAGDGTFAESMGGTDHQHLEYGLNLLMGADERPKDSKWKFALEGSTLEVTLTVKGGNPPELTYVLSRP